MTEQEIKQCLIDNRTDRVPYERLPHEVQQWITDHMDSRIFRKYYGGSYGWDRISHPLAFTDFDHIYTIAGDPDFTPHWVEFRIKPLDRKPVYAVQDIIITADLYFYDDYESFLRNYSDYYDSFGGWWYEGLQKWSDTLITDDSQTFPTKIRFWRYKG